jgi:hypothetical protein
VIRCTHAAIQSSHLCLMLNPPPPESTRENRNKGNGLVWTTVRVQPAPMGRVAGDMQYVAHWSPVGRLSLIRLRFLRNTWTPFYPATTAAIRSPAWPSHSGGMVPFFAWPTITLETSSRSLSGSRPTRTLVPRVSVLGRCEQQIGELVGDQPIDFLGHGAVERAQSGLDVADADSEFGRDQSGGNG